MAWGEAASIKPQQHRHNFIQEKTRSSDENLERDFRSQAQCAFASLRVPHLQAAR
jgi:hypothetical protein